MSNQDYALLGLEPGAHISEVKQAAKRRVDEIKQIHAVLTDAQRRAAYDTDGDTRYYILLGVHSSASAEEIAQAAKQQLAEIKAAYQRLQNEAPAAPATSSADPYAAPQSNLEPEYEEEGYQAFSLWNSRGRVGRVRYMAYIFLISLCVQIPIGVLGFMAGMGGMDGDGAMGAVFGILGLVAGVFMLVINIFLGIKRLHDFNGNGWLILLILVPIVNFIFALILWFVPGTKGANDYGAPGEPYKTWEAVLAGLLIISILLMIVAIIVPAVVSGI